MTQRFGGIFSVLSSRDYNDLVIALRSVPQSESMRVADFPGEVPGFEDLSLGDQEAYNLDTEEIIEL